MCTETTVETAASPARQQKCPSCTGSQAERLLQAPDRFHGRRELFQLVRCPSCSLVWLDNPPPPPQIGEHYGPDYDRSVTAAGEHLSYWQGRWDVLLQHKTSGAILDLGCSAGGFLAGLKGSAWKLYGIEMSGYAATEARAKSGAEVFVGDILDAPFPPGSFDAITCFHLLEHVYQPREVLAKVFEWLKPGGVFYLIVPNIDSAGARIFGSYWYALELPRHLYHFSPKSLRTLARPVGFEEIAVTTDRDVFIESSARYLLDDAVRSVGIIRTPLAKASKPSLFFRVVRKAFRMSVLPVLNGMASFAGDGEIIQAVFRKGTER